MLRAARILLFVILTTLPTSHARYSKNLQNFTQCEDVSGLPFVNELDDLTSNYMRRESEMLRSVSLYAKNCEANQQNKSMVQTKVADVRKTYLDLHKKMASAQNNLENIDADKCAKAVYEAMNKLKVHVDKTAKSVTKACPPPYNL